MIYSTFTNEELLREIDARRSQSPLINDLCRRLEELEDALAPTNPKEGQCPVCDAMLTLVVDEGIVDISVRGF